MSSIREPWSGWFQPVYKRWIKTKQFPPTDKQLARAAQLSGDERTKYLAVLANMSESAVVERCIHNADPIFFDSLGVDPGAIFRHNFGDVKQKKGIHDADTDIFGNVVK